MEFPGPLCLLLVLLTIVTSSQAYKFYVDGSEGWVPNPSESYNEWAGRNRFQINDTLVFKYKKGLDSLMEVNKEDYDKCNKSNPIKKLEDGDTEFKFERSGPFYFISGKDQNCEKGQKMIVVVLAPRGQSQTSPSPKFPSPSSSPKPSPKPSPPSSPSPSPSNPPSSGSLPALVPTPSGHPLSPSSAVSPVPAIGPPAPSPAGSPGPVGGSPTKSPAPTAPPTPPSAGSTTSSPGGAGTPSNSSSETAPPPSQAWVASPTGFLVFSVTIVVGAVLSR